MNTNRTNQIKYNRIYLNKFIPTEESLIELERRNAVKACLVEASKDFGVLAMFVTGVLLVFVIVGC